jgi:hypothetical protein
MFVEGYSQWKAFSPSEKIAYATGLWDGLSPISGSDPSEGAKAFGVQECARKLKINNGMVSEAITAYYQASPKHWGDPPLTAIVKTIHFGTCLPYINEHRAKTGLEPLKELVP